MHLLEAYRLRRERGETAQTAITSAYAGAGRAIRWNALVLALGFSVLCASSLSPNRSLGILLSAAMVACYATTVLIAPLALRRVENSGTFGRQEPEEP